MLGKEEDRGVPQEGSAVQGEKSKAFAKEVETRLVASLYV
jgi:hypothetical protein